MTSTLTPLNAAAAPMLGPTRSDTIDFRSMMIGRLAARTTEIPRKVVRHLLIPHIPQDIDTRTNRVASLIGELISASNKNESLANQNTTESDQSVAYSIAVALQWLFEMEKDFGASLRAQLILKTLMPLYLAAGHGRRGDSIRETLTMVRSICMLPELNRLTIDGDLSTWARERVRVKMDPFESIASSFRIDLAMAANSFWRAATSKKTDSTGNSVRGFEVSALSKEKHRAWWSLAGQLCAQSAQINIPADLAVGVIVWEKLLDHWRRLNEAILDGPETKNIDAPSPGSRSTQVEKKERQHSATSVDSQKSRIADDHRFVEIRSARDPQLSSNLDQSLQHCRNEQGTMALVVAKQLATDSGSQSQEFQNWQSRFIELMDTHGESSSVRGFISGDGELSLVFQDVERAELGQWIRESFAKINVANEESSLATTVALPLVAGVAMVTAPSRSFKIDQLIQSAWRCLDGASKQGAGAVKTIEVY